ncbi:MAG: MarR family transcriptional regulator [Deltaproteobacteria bacterium]|nr:MarR family transcriptional regulator [Deltaproteobacteria bacterium]
MATTKATPAQCAGEIMEMVPVVMRFLRAEARSHGTPFLSVPQFRVLVFLYRHPGASLSSVAEHLGVTCPTASVLIDRLVRRGLVDRTDYPQERRRIALTLTATGGQHLQQARDATWARVASLLAGLSETELHKIVEGVTLLGKVFKEAVTEHGR